MLIKSKVKKQKSNSTVLSRLVYCLILLFLNLSVNAQCAMCRAALTGEDNQVKAEAINDGIVYLMVIPYVLVALIGVYVYRMKKKKS